MKVRELALCRDCEQMLRDAQLIYKALHGFEGEEPTCAFCKQKRFTAKYLVQYGRGVK